MESRARVMGLLNRLVCLLFGHTIVTSRYLLITPRCRGCGKAFPRS